MKYIITRITENTVTIWDQKTRDQDHPNEIAGEMTLNIGPHIMKLGELVTLVVRRVAPPTRT